MVIAMSNMASQIQATEASNYQGVRIKTEPIDTSYDFSNVHVKQEICSTPTSFERNYNDNTQMPLFSYDFSNIHVKQEICSTPTSNTRNQMPEIKQEFPLLDVKKEEPFTIPNNLVKQENSNKNKQRYRPKPMKNVYHKNFNNGDNYGGYYQNVYDYGYDNYGYYNNGYDNYGYGYHGYKNYYNGYYNNNNYQNNRRHRRHQPYKPRNNATRNYTNSQRSNNPQYQNYSYSQPYAFSNATHFSNSYANYQAAYSNYYHHKGRPNYNIPGPYYANWQPYMTQNQSQGPIRHQARTTNYYHANYNQNKNFKKTKNQKKNLVKEENKQSIPKPPSSDSVKVEYAIKLEQSVKIEPLETDQKPPMGLVNPSTTSGPVYPNPFNSSNIAITTPSNASSFSRSVSFNSRMTVSSNAEDSINVPSCSGSTNSNVLGDSTNLPQNSVVLNTSVNSDSLNSTFIEETTLKVMNLPKIWNFENMKSFLEMIDIDSPECTSLMRYDKKMTARLDFGSKEVLLQAKRKLDGLEIGGAKLETLGGIALNDTNSVNTLNDDKLLWRPDLDINQRDPIGLYGLRRKFLLSLQIKPPLEQWVSVTNFNCNKSALCEILQTAGRVVMCDVITSDGCNRALVMYSHPLEAVQAISSLHNKPPSDLHITMDTAPDRMITPFRRTELKPVKPTYKILEELKNHLNGLRTPLCDLMFYEPEVLVPQWYDV